MKSCALFLSLLLTLAGSPAWAEAEYTPVPESVRELDLRIAALEARRAGISTTGPQVALIGGVVLSVVGGILLGATVGACQNRDQDGCAFGGPMAGAALAGVGIITAIGGGVVLGVRNQQRNEIDAERESLIKERDGLAATLSRLELRSPYRNRTQFVTLGVRF